MTEAEKVEGESINELVEQLANILDELETLMLRAILDVGFLAYRVTGKPSAFVLQVHAQLHHQIKRLSDFALYVLREGPKMLGESDD